MPTHPPFFRFPHSRRTWSFRQETDGLPKGGFIDLCQHLGLPFIRLRLALPEEARPLRHFTAPQL